MLLLPKLSQSQRAFGGGPLTEKAFERQAVGAFGRCRRATARPPPRAAGNHVSTVSRDPGADLYELTERSLPKSVDHAAATRVFNHLPGEDRFGSRAAVARCGEGVSLAPESRPTATSINHLLCADSVKSHLKTDSWS